ncbi:MAG: hypothetical protein ACK4UP_12825, partial [Spirosomataceae bacterium]
PFLFTIMDANSFYYIRAAKVMSILISINKNTKKTTTRTKYTSQKPLTVRKLLSSVVFLKPF